MARTLDIAKRSAILSAAKSTFIKDGYAATKMSDIAAAAGVAPGTLYLYFENKEALAGAIGEEFFSRLIDQCGSILQALEGPDGIATLVDWALQVAATDRDVLAMVKERKQEVKTDKQKSRHLFVARLAEALSGLVSRGVIRHYANTTALAELVLAILRRVIMAHALFEDKDTDDLRSITILLLQHALFDDVTLAANRMVKHKAAANE